MELLTERHSEEIAGVICCYDRILIQGALPGLCYAEGMTGYLYAHKIGIFDYPHFAQPLRAHGATIQAWSASSRRWNPAPATSPGTTSRPAGRISAPTTASACTTFYFIDEDLGLCYVRVPAWRPFWLQIYLNGHHRLACRLSRKRIDHTLLDNAFPQIDDFDRAQRIADDWPVERLHRKLDQFAARYCPVIRQLEVRYHWSLDPVEFATNIVFHRQPDLQAIYGNLTRTAIHTVKPDNTEALRENQRCYPGFNFFSAEDQRLFETLARGEFNLHGLQNKTLRRRLPEKAPGQISRLLKRLRLHGFLKKVAPSYRYYLSRFGKQLITTGLKRKQLVLIPQLAAIPSPQLNFVPESVRI